MVNENIPQILNSYKKIAVIGISNKPDRPSHYVSYFMKEHGYQIYPVNPGLDEVLGEKCYPSLSAIPDQIEIVDIFRRAEFVDEIVKKAIEVNARVIWMQQGIINENAAQQAIEAGLQVVMDRCIKTEYGRMMMRL
jgi:predicted CoA-binding protein